MEATDEGRQGEDEAALTGSLVLVGGPIASGKSTLARAVARRLRDGGTSAGVVDVDQVYEMLEERGHSPGKTELWHKAHRLAGRIAAGLLAEGTETVLVEGDFLGEDTNAELLQIVRPTSVRRITLITSIETARARVESDPDRGISRDARFLAKHYEEISATLAQRPRDELVIDTERLTVEQAAARVTDWLEG